MQNIFIILVSFVLVVQSMDSNELLAQVYDDKYRRVDFKRHHEMHDRSIKIRNDMFVSKMKHNVMQKMDVQDRFEPTPNINLLVEQRQTGFWDKITNFVTKLIQAPDDPIKPVSATQTPQIVNDTEEFILGFIIGSQNLTTTRGNSAICVDAAKSSVQLAFDLYKFGNIYQPKVALEFATKWFNLTQSANIAYTYCNLDGYLVQLNWLFAQVGIDLNLGLDLGSFVNNFNATEAEGRQKQLLDSYQNETGDISNQDQNQPEQAPQEIEVGAVRHYLFEKPFVRSPNLINNPALSRFQNLQLNVSGASYTDSNGTISANQTQNETSAEFYKDQLIENTWYLEAARLTSRVSGLIFNDLFNRLFIIQSGWEGTDGHTMKECGENIGYLVAIIFDTTLG